MGKQFEDDEDDMDMYVTIEFDDGSEVDYKVIGIFEIEGQDYVAVSDDYEEDKPDFSVEFYRHYEDEEGTPSIESIPDDEEYEMVAEVFDRFMQKKRMQKNKLHLKKEAELICQELMMMRYSREF